MRTVLLALGTTLVATPLAAQSTPDIATFRQALHDRFGTTELTIRSGADSARLDLVMRDKRYRGMGGLAFADSAKVVARFAAKNLPKGYRPDSIVVTIFTHDSSFAGGRNTSSNTALFATAHLH